MRIACQIVFLAFAVTGCTLGVAGAHPMPDVLVRSFFYEDGSAAIRIELDLRSFTEDPLNEPYTENWMLNDMAADERAELVAKAEDYVNQAVELRFLPAGMVEPEFAWRFTGHDDAPLEKVDDPVMLTGEWTTAIPPDAEGYQVHAKDYRDLSVYFLNHVRDEAVERYQVMFPGETSYVLDLKGLGPGTQGKGEEAAPGSAPEKAAAVSPGPASNVVIPLAIIAAVIPLLMFAMILLKRKVES